MERQRNLAVSDGRSPYKVKGKQQEGRGEAGGIGDISIHPSIRRGLSQKYLGQPPSRKGENVIQ